MAALALGGALVVLESTCLLPPSGCTLVGCTDGAGFAIRATGGLWPTGVYEIRIALDGTEHLCSLQVSEDFGAAPRGFDLVPCDPSLEFRTFPDSFRECWETQLGTACNEPVPSFRFVGSPEGMPVALRVTIVHDGELLFAESRQFAYREFAPNGEVCGPVCEQGTAEFAVDQAAP